MTHNYKILYRAVKYIIVVSALLFALFPFYWMVINVFKDRMSTSVYPPRYFPFVDYQPSTLSWETLMDPAKLTVFISYYTNSLIIALGSCLLSTLIGSVAAYSLARFQFKKWKNEDIMFYILSQRVFPPVVVAVPYFLLFKTIGMLDNHLALIMVYTAANLPMCVWLMTEFFRGIPVDMEECAMVDGCSRFRAMLKITFPLAVSGIVVTTIFSFIFAWNEFLFALTLTFKQAKTLPVHMAGWIGWLGPEWWNISLQGLIIILPPMLLALTIQRYIVKGLTLGAVKA